MEISESKKNSIITLLNRLFEKQNLNEQVNWEEIKCLGSPGLDLQMLIDVHINSGQLEEGTTKDEYMKVYKSYKLQNEKSTLEWKAKTSYGITNDDISINELKVQKSKGSNWYKYKLHLKKNKGWSDESISNLEESTDWILKRLNTKRRSLEDIRKGLVVGNVQSGKTASMAGLMAAASDHGFNFFIIMSGMISNLKKQTEERLIDDLNSDDNVDGSYWESITNIYNKNRSHELARLKLEDNLRSDKYFTVVLKNTNHLAGLITWLKKDKEKMKKLNVLIIDDESDQAGINTKLMDFASDEDFDRSTINKRLIDIVNFANEGESFGAMNYVAYTATPYANILNENEFKSLFPHHFIHSLEPSPLYIGPKQIYGHPEDTESDNSLDIVNLINRDEIKEIREVEELSSLPYHLESALLWFVNGLSILRNANYKKPVSMLIHTSQKITDHESVKRLIVDWFNDITKEKFLKKCEIQFNNEKNKLSKKDFLKILPEYEKEITIDIPNIDFSDLIPELEYIYKESLDSIKLFDEEREFSSGIHLCVDNSKHNLVIDNESYRLAYPNHSQLKSMDKAPGFIVIGGATLSRGLTLEGLISTYFIRTTKIADTLMQMGRWFGYRIGYELIPRIWMSNESLERFRFLVQVDENLRKIIKNYNIGDKTPKEYGMEVTNSPDYNFMRITGKNRSQAAQETEINFTGYKPQDINFTNDSKILKHNIDLTEEFFADLGRSQNNYLNRAVFWESVALDRVFSDYLEKFQFNSRTAAFNNLKAIRKWCEDNRFLSWNVAAVGKCVEKESDKTWKVDGKHLLKANRSVKGELIKTDDGKEMASIGVLRNPDDFVADFGADPLLTESKEDIRKNSEQCDTPLLLVYRLNKKYEPLNSNNRQTLDFSDDITALSIIIPGAGNKKPRGLKLVINAQNLEQDIEGEES
ncbi:hypothetical protein [Oceanobacillus iheyensis HTE831]|uniref:Putative endonuclease Z1 domain-containing protein n=1 Tax=Oceanobacillus iheyensis (strain DSM 14371 / CIP 107618 / JCM 11309 / KCTC 3954 / HTE831) TaxID=221109 RepID=Q8EL91_OCEIH|nr:Z1 domain-containing protein [Oceanobacillus iheyensis]BAC15296.1 hypothetical protein [Oceanobacillus iheyensis HTE831]